MDVSASHGRSVPCNPVRTGYGGDCTITFVYIATHGSRSVTVRTGGCSHGGHLECTQYEDARDEGVGMGRQPKCWCTVLVYYCCCCCCCCCCCVCVCVC